MDGSVPRSLPKNLRLESGLKNNQKSYRLRQAKRIFLEGEMVEGKTKLQEITWSVQQTEPQETVLSLNFYSAIY